jgi:Secretion system C-terminal sorting domain/Putative metal-binding motif
MKHFLLVFFFFISISATLGQITPVNDDCAGAIPMVCGEVYSNVNATPSVVAPDSMPACWGNIYQDVWFSFTPPNDSLVNEFVFILNSTGDSVNALTHARVSLYRGECWNEMYELLCTQSYGDGNLIVMNVFDLTYGYNYYFRIDYDSLMPGASAGTFTVCFEEFIQDNYVMGEDELTTLCQGYLFDNGGATGVYSDSSDFLFTITSVDSVPLTLLFSQFDMATGDTLFIYDGTSTNAPLIGAYTETDLMNGSIIGGGNLSGSITINQVTNTFGAYNGFALEWFEDFDGDGFGPTVCEGVDCDDYNPLINPDIIEILDNWIDDNCDGIADTTITSVQWLVPTNPFVISPNPTIGQVQIITPVANAVTDIQMFDCLGRQVLQTQISQSGESISLESLAAGLYFIRCQQGELTGTDRVMKR